MNPVYTLHVKNMVCHRCILIVKNILSSLEIEGNVVLGRISIAAELDTSRQGELVWALQQVGLEVIESRINRLIEDIRQMVRDYLALGFDVQKFKLSSFVSSRLPYDFGYLSDVFSKVEGLSIEKYFILQRIEKVKELIAYDQLSLSEIAYETGFSSVHHLSAQFKKMTGSTPSQYKAAAIQDRRPLDLVGA
jgi:AraC family transcriptional regulator